MWQSKQLRNQLTLNFAHVWAVNSYEARQGTCVSKSVPHFLLISSITWLECPRAQEPKQEVSHSLLPQSVSFAQYSKFTRIKHAKGLGKLILRRRKKLSEKLSETQFISVCHLSSFLFRHDIQDRHFYDYNTIGNIHGLLSTSLPPIHPLRLVKKSKPRACWMS